ncbi:MAG TPA: two-component regulator propeller domain-containing protein [Candidatus Nitrosocosmicus sp.]|nr:two-component regulator propeller domain-containing protein [Candidatus Nitrosocosmicus sp.]
MFRFFSLILVAIVLLTGCDNSIRHTSTPTATQRPDLTPTSTLPISTETNSCGGQYSVQHSNEESHYTPENTLGGLTFPRIRFLYFDKEWNLWIGYGVRTPDAQEGGITRFDGETFDFCVILNHVNCILRDHNGNIWAGTDSQGGSMKSGLYRFFDKDWIEITSNLPDNRIFTLMEHDKKMYVGTWNGVGVYDGKNWSTLEIPGPPNIHAMLFDSQGRKWFGSVKSGIMMQNSDGSWKTLRAPVLAGNGIRSIVEHPHDQSIWIGAQSIESVGGGVSVLRGDKWVTYGFTNDVIQLAFDSKNRIWAATHSGTYYLENDRWVKFDSNPSNAIVLANCDCPFNAKVIIGTVGNGLLVLDVPN